MDVAGAAIVCVVFMIVVIGFPLAIVRQRLIDATSDRRFIVHMLRVRHRYS
jgi:hypothetical protein